MNWKPNYQPPGSEINQKNATRNDDKDGDMQLPEDVEPEVIRMRKVGPFTCAVREPFLFWQIVASETGYIPEPLQGMYTTTRKLEEAVKKYLEKSPLKNDEKASG